MRIDYTRFAWFTPALLAQVVPVLKANPEMGRPTLSKVTGLSMHKCEHLLLIFNDYDLYQYLDGSDPVNDIIEALKITQDQPESEDGAILDDENQDEAEWELGEDQFEGDEAYYYDAAADLYLVTLRLGSKQKVVRVPGEVHRAMREAYSDWDGEPLTLNQIAKRFGVSRRWFYAYKTALGWTHDQDPFTDEEVAQNDVDELARRALQRKRYSLEKRYDQLQEEQDRKDADKFRRLEHLVIDPLMARLERLIPEIRVTPLDLALPSQEPIAAVINPADLHYGKLGAPGRVNDPYDRKTARDRLRWATRALLLDIVRFGQPEEIIVGMAGDWFHIDNALLGTTKGTRMTTDGDFDEIIEGGVDLAIEFVTMLAQASPKVRLVKVRGNHDAFATQFLIKALKLVAPHIGNVEIVDERRERTYITYGEVLMGFTHGDLWQPRTTPQKILTEPPREMLARTVERIWFTGHKHFEEYRNEGAIMHYQLPSLSGDDPWHDDQGYNESSKALSGWVLRPKEGVVCNLLAKVPR